MARDDNDRKRPQRDEEHARAAGESSSRRHLTRDATRRRYVDPGDEDEVVHAPPAESPPKPKRARRGRWDVAGDGSSSKEQEFVMAPHDNALDDDSPAPQQPQASSKGKKRKKEVNNNFGSTDGGKPVSESLGNPVCLDDEAAAKAPPASMRPSSSRSTGIVTGGPPPPVPPAGDSPSQSQLVALKVAHT